MKSNIVEEDLVKIYKKKKENDQRKQVRELSNEGSKEYIDIATIHRKSRNNNEWDGKKEICSGSTYKMNNGTEVNLKNITKETSDIKSVSYRIVPILTLEEKTCHSLEYDKSKSNKKNKDATKDVAKINEIEKDKNSKDQFQKRKSKSGKLNLSNEDYKENISATTISRKDCGNKKSNGNQSKNSQQSDNRTNETRKSDNGKAGNVQDEKNKKYQYEKQQSTNEFTKEKRIDSHEYIRKMNPKEEESSDTDEFTPTVFEKIAVPVRPYKSIEKKKTKALHNYSDLSKYQEISKSTHEEYLGPNLHKQQLKKRWQDNSCYMAQSFYDNRSRYVLLEQQPNCSKLLKPTITSNVTTTTKEKMKTNVEKMDELFIDPDDYFNPHLANTRSVDTEKKRANTTMRVSPIDEKRKMISMSTTQSSKSPSSINQRSADFDRKSNNIHEKRISLLNIFHSKPKEIIDVESPKDSLCKRVNTSPKKNHHSMRYSLLQHFKNRNSGALPLPNNEYVNSKKEIPSNYLNEKTALMKTSPLRTTSEREYTSKSNENIRKDETEATQRQIRNSKEKI